MATKKTLYGGETTKAVDNFPISGETVPVAVVHWLGRIKGAAARVNARARPARPEARRSAIADGGRRGRRRRARRPVPDRRLPDRLGHLVEHERQRGHRGARRRAGPPERPREHGPVVQRRLPVARCTSPRSTRRRTTLLPALKQLERSFDAQGEASSRTSSSPAARTSWTPCRSRSARSSPATPRRSASARSASRPRSSTSRQIPLGGTATGTGLNTHPKFAEKVRKQLTKETKLKIDAPRRPVRGAGQPRRARRAVRRAEGRRRLADEDRERPRADGLGPARRHRRDLPARAAEGLVDHARQGQPGHPRGRAAGRRAGDRQRHRDHDRRHAGPVRAQRAHPADRAQPAAVDPPARDRRRPRSPRSASTAIEVNKDGHRALGRRRRSPSRPRSTSTSATTRRRRSSRRRRSPGARCARSRSRRASTPRLYDEAIDLRRIAAGSQADAQADGKPSRPRRSSGSSNGATTRRRRTQRASA